MECLTLAKSQLLLAYRCQVQGKQDQHQLGLLLPTRDQSLRGSHKQSDLQGYYLGERNKRAQRYRNVVRRGGRGSGSERHALR